MGHPAIQETNLPVPERATILVVDDDATLLRSSARTLRRAGYDVRTATSALAAIASFEEEPADVVLSDISMPGMDGVGLVAAIQKLDPHVPVILVTGLPSVETAVQAMDSGAMRYLIKPVDPDELTTITATAVRKRRTAELQAAAAAAMSELHPPAETDLQNRFRAALDALYMVYQPIVRWSSRSVAGYEALVRSSEPSIPHPGALFDAAEKLSATRELARVIRAKTPGPMAAQPDRGLLFYNLHVRDLEDESLYDPNSDLARMADRVVLEITERAALDDIKEPQKCVRRLREMGYRIAIDDLGAGYSGLNSFAELEPDVVKLDMTLVRGVHLSNTKQKLVRSITALCRDMGIEVVAEGVETAEERDCVIALGCDLLQGYFFARPAAPFVEPLL